MTKNALGVFLATLVKAVHVELSDKGVDLLVPEVLGQDHFLELSDVPDHEFLAIRSPINHPAILFIL